MSRLRIKNKIKKKKIVKLEQKLEASQRKIAILRAYNVELEAGKNLYTKFRALENKNHINLSPLTYLNYITISVVFFLNVITKVFNH